MCQKEWAQSRGWFSQGRGVGLPSFRKRAMVRPPWEPPPTVLPSVAPRSNEGRTWEGHPPQNLRGSLALGRLSPRSLLSRQPLAHRPPVRMVDGMGEREVDRR